MREHVVRSSRLSCVVDEGIAFSPQRSGGGEGLLLEACMDAEEEPHFLMF